MPIKKKIYDIKPPRNWKTVSSHRDNEEDLLEVHKIQKTVEEIPPINYLEEDEDTSWLKNIKEKNTLRKIVTPKIHFKHFHLIDQSLFKKIIIPLCGVIFLVGLYLLAFVILPKATVNINTVKTPGVYNARVFIATTEASDGTTQADTLLVPAKLYVVNHEESQEFLATGNKIGGSKATVKLNIYNNYSTLPQILVTSTRFQTESGKVFRLDSRLVIPPAKKDNQGTLTPVYIEAMATADEAGDSYNVPAGKFTIPGFSGTKKFEGFYAISEKAATGGSLGGIKSVTSDDLKNAETKVGKDLLNGLDEELKVKVAVDYKILEGAKNYKMQQIESTAKTDQVAEKFTVTMSGEIRVIAFKESDLQKLVTQQLQKQIDTTTDIYGEPALEYTINKVDFTKGSLTGQIKANWSSRPLISQEEIINNLAGKNIGDAKTYLENIPNMNKTSIKL
ncbi:MAG: hypothetical protein NTX26_02620, partial [Candidatus Parcubacteria bacterium]|nr:hypothetical protein [Candidatus Parcubacteria bacterium]